MPGPGNPMAGGEATVAAMAAVWPLWVFLLGLAIAIWILGRWWFNRLLPSPGLAANPLLRWQTVFPLILVAALWVVLFVHNTRLVPHGMGFDAGEHLDYITYLQQHRALPLPDKGWEMFQPPLYYVISATALSSFGLKVSDDAAVTVLRLLTLGFGLAQLTLVFLSLRLLFPGRVGRQMVGLMLAAFLPMQLYLSHYVTNETLGATLVSATLYLSLRLLRAEQASVVGYAGLGLCLGAALLTKVTGLLLVPFILIAVVARPRTPESSRISRWCLLGGTLAVCFAVCGWYYFWIWRHFGKPFVGNWDAITGLQWWQDSGYHTAADFTRFGRSLVQPPFSAFVGFADGIYSTLWGDGLCGGVTAWIFRPPWNYDLMCAGYVLAILPTLLVLTGAAAAVGRFLRQPAADWFVLLGFCGTVLGALLFMNLKVPSYAQAKAFYGLCALVPFCALGAVGWEVLTRGRKVLQPVLGVLLLLWALNSFGAMWIRDHSAFTHIYLGNRLHAAGRTEAAVVEFGRAIELDPANALARRFLASVLSETGRTEAAWQPAVQAVQLDPDDGAGHRALGMILAQQGQGTKALAEARRAVELGPEDLSAYQFLSGYLSRRGRDDELIDVTRNGLAVFPYDSILRYGLGMAFAQKGDLADATNQFAYSLLLEPGWADAHLTFGRTLVQLGNVLEGLRHLREAVRLAPGLPRALNELAWLLATSPDAAVRNGPEAVRLAEQACAASGRRDPGCLGTLAAAYAEVGRFPEAISTAQEALFLGQTMGSATAINRAEKLKGCFQSGRPFREHPVLHP
jgi:tetratricopeptide (TPR) repeat protein